MKLWFNGETTDLVSISEARVSSIDSICNCSKNGCYNFILQVLHTKAGEYFKITFYNHNKRVGIAQSV